MQPDGKVYASGREMLLGEFLLSASILPLRDRYPPTQSVCYSCPVGSLPASWEGAQGDLSLSSFSPPLCLSLEGGDLHEKPLLHPLKTASTPRRDMSSLSRNQLYSTTFPSHPVLHGSPPILSAPPPQCRREACCLQGPPLFQLPQTLAGRGTPDARISSTFSFTDHQCEAQRGKETCSRPTAFW